MDAILQGHPVESMLHPLVGCGTLYSGTPATSCHTGSTLAPTPDQRSKDKRSLWHKEELEGSTAIGRSSQNGNSQSQAFPLFSLFSFVSMDPANCI